MNTLLASVPDALKRRTLTDLEKSFGFINGADFKEAEKLFEPYAKIIEEEFRGYAARHLYVSEIDLILEEQRIRGRVFDKYPGSRTVASLLEHYALGQRRIVHDLKADFVRAGGRKEQFDALLEIAESNVLLRRKQDRPAQASGAPFIG